MEGDVSQARMRRPSAHAIPAHNLFKVFERPHQGPWRAPGEGMGCPGLAAPLPQALRPGMAPVPPFWRARGPEERFAPPTPAPPPALWPDLQPAEPAEGWRRRYLAAEHGLRFFKGHFGGKHLAIPTPGFGIRGTGLGPQGCSWVVLLKSYR